MNTNINMSYCRFQNTALAYRECVEAINGDEDISDISIDEKYALMRLVTLSQQLLDEVRKSLDLNEHDVIDTPSLMKWVDI